ncbi:equilibrative nucleoside transporter 1-like isoform X3 [Antennarius striatus]|uniref:equilibrative nucleoside transporter 1-like isoform X3 n=1 Tax=Antennarius striatus TaxID=241820 RepID=UPI0035AE3A23
MLALVAVTTTSCRYFGVWLIFFTLGLGTLLPWNFFITATTYFTSRLKDSSTLDSSANQTEAAGEHRSHLEAIFNNVMTLCAMLPLLLCTCLHSLLHSRVPQRLRVMGSLLIIMVVFIVTAILVKVPLEPLPFFCITMVKIVIINCFGAVLQGSLFGGSRLHDAAFGYFITACVVIFLAILSYILLPKLEFFRFYQETNRKQRSDKENTVDLMDRGSKDEPLYDNRRQRVAMMTIFKKIWLLALSVCLTFTITIGVFPAITADTRSTLASGGAWERFFIPVCCFLLFNLCDWGGRSFTAICMWPQKESVLLPVFVGCRLVFIPLFMLCNVHPRVHLPVLMDHDGWFIAIMVVFAFSNGYLASLCMCYGPKNVPPQEAETAGAIMAFFLCLGLASGAALSFIIRALV